MNRLTHLALTTALLFSSAALSANELAYTSGMDDQHIHSIITRAEPADTAWMIDLGWDSEYISKGRNLLDKGGIYWTTAAYQYDDVTLFASLGRGDSSAYIEWDLGFEYGLSLTENLQASIGAMHIRCFGDDDFRDNELFASLSYSQFDWFTPSVLYTYSTEAAGYIIEASVHSSWSITEALTLTPYITQSFDFQYATEAHNGANHFQFGLEAEYQLQEQLLLSAHISRSLAQQDIKQELGPQGDLNQTFAGIHLTWSF